MLTNIIIVVPYLVVPSVLPETKSKTKINIKIVAKQSMSEST